MKPLLIRAGLLLGLLLPGACAGQDSYMTNAACRQKVYDNPDVGHRIARNGATYSSPDGEESLTEMKQRVYVDCLRGQGLAPKGGVEAVKRF